MLKVVTDKKTGEVYTMYAGRRILRPVVDCAAAKDGRTKTEHAKSCDLKERIRVYQERGILPGAKQPAGPQHDVDLTAYPDSYHDALNLVARVGQHFASLPSDIRTKFHNDPKLYLADLEKRQKDNNEAAAKAAGMAREAFQYDLEGKVSAGRAKAAARDERVKKAMQDPKPDPKEGHSDAT